MHFQQVTIPELFDTSRKSFEIPVYQRAYSWNNDQWSAFLGDLIEQTAGHSNYFFGNILLETIKKGVKYEVIDGQQRLTTLTIFIRAVLIVIKERQTEGEEIDFSIDEKLRLYFKDSGNIKLRPVDYDRACYDTLIIDGVKDFKVANTSQKLILEARNYFQKQLEKMETDEILSIVSKLETTEITTIELEGKRDAALMFELQNNRGKDLTNMERLKSYLMYQLYIFSPQDDAEGNIAHIADVFKLIYTLANDIKTLPEDSILIYHSNAYINGYDYRSLDDIKDVFKAQPKESRVQWIKDFMQELHTTFSNMKLLSANKDSYLRDLRELKMPVFVYPFFIKGYKYFGDDPAKLSRLFHLMEVVVFRFRLISSRGDFISRLNPVLKSFTGNLDLLIASFKAKLNEEYLWADYRVREYLEGNMYDNWVISYLLWRYEASIQGTGYTLGSMKLEDEQIEHISPQTPPDGETVATGYQTDSQGHYTDDFRRDYLNCLGNLMLISGNHNRVIGNKPFVKKLQSYQANPLLNQQRELPSFAKGSQDSPCWSESAIDERHSKIYNFAVATWSLTEFRNSGSCINNSNRKRSFQKSGAF